MVYLYCALLAIVLGLSVAQDASSVCTTSCDKMKLEVLTLAMCRDAKKTLPKPKIGDFCTIAMEQGYSDACFALCMFAPPQNRVAQACRAASMEMPRPTVRRWCEHGYNVAYDKTLKDLKTYFVDQDKIEAHQEVEEVHHHESEEAVDHSATHARVINTIAVSLDDQMFDLNIHENESAEDAVALFCNTHAADDTPSCIRHLLPVVLNKLDESTV